MKKKPKNGDIIKCDSCPQCHRITTPYDNRRLDYLHGILAFECKGKNHIAAVNGVLKKTLKIVKPVGLRALSSEQHSPLNRNYGSRR